MKKTLITGIRSFTGQYLLRELRKHGYIVYGTIYEDLCLDHERTADITKVNDLKRVLTELQPDYIVHLAGISFVPMVDESKIYQVNLLGTLNLIQAIKKTELCPKKILIPSTANVYGNPTQNPVDETAPTLPINHYGNSKLAMENALKLYFEDYPILITRPFNYSGTGQAENFLIPKIVNHYRVRAKEIQLGNLDIIRDFSSVKFIAEAYRLLLESDASGEIVNICSGIGITLFEIIAIMDEFSGYSLDVKSNSDFIRKSEIHTLIGSNKKLQKLLGPLQNISIQDVLKEMYFA